MSSVWTWSTKSNELKADVVLTDGFAVESKEARAMMWYMMQPGHSLVTRLEKVESVMLPNLGTWTVVKPPPNWRFVITDVNELRCKVEHTDVDDSYLQNGGGAPVSGTSKGDGSVSGGGGGGGKSGSDGSQRKRKAFRVSVSCKHVDANTLARLVTDVQLMYNDSSKGFDYDTQQIFELAKGVSSHGSQVFLSGVPFKSNVRLENTFLDDEVECRIQARLKMFRSPEQHERLGTPRTLSILLYGPPGTGKTSVIKAMANETRRHVIRVNLAVVRNRGDLMSLFHPDRITVILKNWGVETIFMPMNSRLYVFEELDEQTPIVLCRKGMRPPDILEDSTPVEVPDDMAAVKQDDAHLASSLEALRQEVAQMRAEAEEQCPQSFRSRVWNASATSIRNASAAANLSKESNTHINGGSLTLGDALEVLDGLIEMDGRFIIFTTNRLEALDPAIVRPGRMDIKVRLGEMGASALERMARRFFGDEASSEVFLPHVQTLSGVLTPAEIGGCMMEAKTTDGDHAAARGAISRMFGLYERKRQSWRTSISTQMDALRGAREGLVHKIAAQRALADAIAVGDMKAHENALSVLGVAEPLTPKKKKKVDAKQKTRKKDGHKKHDSDDADDKSSYDSDASSATNKSS